MSVRDGFHYEVSSELLSEIARLVSAVSPTWAELVHEQNSDKNSEPAELELGVELIREGWLMHRGASRIIADPDTSKNLLLLVGDWCYAAGLVKVAHSGTLEDVQRLSVLIADLSARHDEPLEHFDTAWRETLAAF